MPAGSGADSEASQAASPSSAGVTTAPPSAAAQAAANLLELDLLGDAPAAAPAVATTAARNLNDDIMSMFGGGAPAPAAARPAGMEAYEKCAAGPGGRRGIIGPVFWGAR